MHRSYKAMILLILAVFVFAACSSPPVDDDLQSMQNRITTLEDQVERLEEENANLRLEIETLTTERDEYKEALDALAEGDEEDVETPLAMAFKLHGSTSQGDPQVVGSVNIPTNLPLEEKLQYLGDALTEEVFKGLFMEFDGFRTMEGSEVAVMNLIEPDNQAVGDPSWIYDHFQGSTGGMITVRALVETFLQREYEGEWIEGVYFILNGETIEYQHVEGLEDPHFR